MKQFGLLVLAFCLLNAAGWDFRVPAQGEGKTWLSPRYAVDPTPGSELVIDWTYQFSDSMWCPDRIIWFDGAGKRINAEDYRPQPMFFQAGKKLLGKKLEYRQSVPRSHIPPNAREFQLKLLGNVIHPDHRNAYVDFMNPQISWNPVVTAKAPYNWFEREKGVEFFCHLPDGEKLRGVIFDSDGKTVADIVSAPGTWRWNPAQPGFYSVKFSRIAPDGKETVIPRQLIDAITTEEFGFMALDSQIRLPREIQCFAVTETAANPVCGDPDSPFGSNASANPASVEKEIDVIARMNLSSFIRYHWFHWNEIEKEKGKYDWSNVDRVLEIGEKKGFPQERVLLNTFGTPKWNTSKENPDEGSWTRGYYFYAPKDLKPWGDFLTAFAKRYPRLKTWELWNEPHLDGFSIFWQKSTPKRYVELLKTGYEALKKADPRNTVVSGGIAMRYMPWYTEFLKEGGNRWCDMIGTHNGYDHSQFHKIEKLRNAPSHPFFETEWHANLFECRMENYPTEEELSYWMLVNLANLLTQGKERIMVFCPFNASPRELAVLKAKMPGIQQICGLFRTLPNYEPRHQAYSLRVAVDRFQGKVKSLGAWTFRQNSQTAAAFESKKGKVLFFWAHEGNEKQPVFAPQIQQSLKGKKLLDWEGRPVTWKDLRYGRVYYGIEPDIAALGKGGTAVSYLPTPRRQGGKQVLEHMYRGNYSPLKNPVWHKMTHFEPMGGTTTAAPNFKARFAVDLTPKALELWVEVSDDKHCPTLENPKKLNFWDYDSVQFAIDTKGLGDRDDVLEFEAGANGRLVKLAGPSIGGDLSDEYSPPNFDVRRGSAKITRNGNMTTYRITLPATDLYPFQPRTGMPLRFSILVNDNNGKGREGYLEWGSGIGGIKSAAKYGDLSVPTGKTLVASQKNLFRPFQDAEVTKGDIVRVRAAANTTRGAGVVCERIPVISGGRYEISGEVRGSAGQLIVMCHGKGMKRFDLPLTTVTGNWSKFSGEVTIPEGMTQLTVVLFYWNAPGKEFEIRNFQVRGL